MNFDDKKYLVYSVYKLSVILLFHKIHVLHSRYFDIPIYEIFAAMTITVRVKHL